MSNSFNHAERATFEMPALAAQALERIHEPCAQEKPFNASELKNSFNETLWWGTESGSPEAEEQAHKRVQALGWALQELEAWGPEHPYAIYRLQIVLTTLLMSSPSDKEAAEAVPLQMAHQPLLGGLITLVESMHTSTQSHRHHLSERQWQEETQAAGRTGDYSKLGQLIRHLSMEPSPDIPLAIMLVWRFAPDRLARHIDERQDVFFSVAVRDALTDEALKFSLSVNDITFKFICAAPLADVEAADTPEGSVEIMRDLLLQVAQTDRWYPWLLDFARYPKAETVAEKALSEALMQLTAAHWSAFVDAVELWTYAGTAGPVANILVPFLHGLGDEKSADMWRLAFERWNKWDYGRDEKNKHLSAPSICSFDFPVAMYYALLPLEEALAEETRLLEGIATIEQNWFTDLSELVTYRNRLSSRLRLVQHGFAIRNPPSGGANVLPPCIEPDSEFAKVRYQFFDVSAPMRRGR